MRKIFLLIIFVYAIVSIQAQNNVGIGTSTPTTKLQVTDSTNAVAIKVNTVFGPFAGIELNASEDVTTNYFRILKENNTSTPLNRTIFNNGIDAGPFIFSHGSTERFRIDNNGRVGINYGSHLDSRMHIYSNDNTPVLTLQSANFPRLNFSNNTNLLGYLSASTSSMNLSSFGNKAINFNINEVPKMVVDTTGRVGIGLTSPQEKLDVNGNILTSGEIKPNGASGLENQVLISNGNGTMQWAAMNSYGEGGAGAGPWDNWCTDNVSEYLPMGDIDEELNNFGYAVSISGNFAIIGSPNDNENGFINSGSASIFVKNLQDNKWVFKQKLLNIGAQGGDQFGHSVSIFGDYAIIGAPSDDEGLTDNGSVTIFKRNSTSGIWESQGKYINQDSGASDGFGYSVSIFGNFAIIGTPLDDEFDTDKGSASILKRNASTGIWEGQIKISNIEAVHLGWSVSISENYAIIGAPNSNSNGNFENGKAFIFKRNITSDTWEFDTTLTDPTSGNQENFGFSVSIFGKYAVIGAPNDDENGQVNCGSVNIYRNDHLLNWVSTTKLVNDNSSSNDNFGNAVAISENYVIVGSKNDNEGAYTLNGSSSIFKRFGSIWRLLQKISSPDSDHFFHFGSSVGVDSNSGRFIIGAGDYIFGSPHLAFFGKIK